MIKPTSRSLLEAIGVGQFNATQIIPYMMIAPATTDPKAPQIVLLVRAIQKAIYALGANYVPDSGRLDAPTARALLEVTGPNWERMAWADNVQAIVDAKKANRRLSSMTDGAAPGRPVAVGGPLDFLPDVPGGLFTYAIAGFFIYRHLAKRAR